MINILAELKRKIFDHKSDEESAEKNGVDSLIALGVLLWSVAEADNKFLPQELKEIETVLSSISPINQEDMPIVLRAIEEASLNRIDLFSFTKEVSGSLNRPEKIAILENLFRVACVDKNLGEEEHEVLRTISNLFRLEHDDFIDVKIRIKKEFGMDTAGL